MGTKNEIPEHFKRRGPSVGERDKAEIEARTQALNTMARLFRDEQAGRERDGRQIARLTEKIRRYFVAIGRAPGNRDENEIAKATEALVAVLSGEDAPCRCPAGSYDFPNAAHEPYCPRAVLAENDVSEED